VLDAHHPVVFSSMIISLHLIQKNVVDQPTGNAFVSRYFGLQWVSMCSCENTIPTTPAYNCGDHGRLCGDGVPRPGIWSEWVHNTPIGPGCEPVDDFCSQSNAVFSMGKWAPAPPSVASSIRGIVSTLSPTVIIGSNAYGPNSFEGSIAMLQVYRSALSTSQIACVYESGSQLVQNGRMAQSLPSQCRGRVSTGCTMLAAENGPEALRIPVPSVDDGSCHFGQLDGALGESGVVTISDTWQTVPLQGSYAKPIVLCSIITRQSTTSAIVRVRNVQIDR
jgi:hypothetical protein